VLKPFDTMRPRGEASLYPCAGKLFATVLSIWRYARKQSAPPNPPASSRGLIPGPSSPCNVRGPIARGSARPCHRLSFHGGYIKDLKGPIWTVSLGLGRIAGFLSLYVPVQKRYMIGQLHTGSLCMDILGDIGDVTCHGAPPRSNKHTIQLTVMTQ
jgi:hypothetical protein